jgi:outer membrane lipoprotein-sorting protein
MRSHQLRIGIALAFASALVAAEDLPKGETILDKYVEVTGGKAAYSKLHNQTVSGTTEFKTMGMKGKLTVYTAEPDKHYTEIELAGIGKIQEGSNGDVVWAYSAMQGPHIKEGDEKAESLLQGKFNSELNWRDLFKSAETTGLETVDGKDCYKVVLTPKAGPPMTKWFAKDSGLLMKMAMTSKTPMGEIQSDSAYSDYRKEGDVLVPHKVVTHVATMELVMTVDSVQTNTEIPKDKFDPPAEVKALMNKPAAK